MTQRHYTYADEQRNASRFGKEPRSERAVVFHPDLREVATEVHDESLGGIRLVVKDASQFILGEEVNIAYLGSLLKAKVRRFEPYEDGKSIVGFECEPPS